MNFKHKLIFILLLILGLSGCGSDSDSDIQGVDLNLDYVRTDSLLYLAAKSFHQNPKADKMEVYNQYLKPHREFWLQTLGFFPGDPRMPQINDAEKDSLLAQQFGAFLADSASYALLDTIQKVFPYGAALPARLVPIFKRMKKNFPAAQIPAIRTHFSGYTPPGEPPVPDPTLPMPDYLSVGLHYHLGEKCRYYPPDIPNFATRRYADRFLEVNIAREIAEGLVPPVDLRKNPSLLDKCVREGIRQNVVDALVPNAPDSMKLYYTAKQMAWVTLYEKNVYKEILPLLYSKDFMMHKPYLEEKPYTSELAMESAPRLGEFVGWMIVKKYRENHPEVSIAQLAERTDYEQIFKDSQYKP